MQEVVKTKLRNEAVDRWGEAHVASIEQKHPGVSLIKVGDKMGFFKKPDRKILGAATSFAAAEPIKYVEVIAENCFVDGDKELLTDDDYFLSLMPLVNELVNVKTAELAKL